VVSVWVVETPVEVYTDGNKMDLFLVVVTVVALLVSAGEVNRLHLSANTGDDEVKCSH
jgi:hypothetical protein